jgi:hypothetical protein
MASLLFCENCKENSIVKKPYHSKALRRELYYTYCLNKHCKSYDMYRHKGFKNRPDAVDMVYKKSA